MLQSIKWTVCSKADFLKSFSICNILNNKLNLLRYLIKCFKHGSFIRYRKYDIQK